MKTTKLTDFLTKGQIKTAVWLNANGGAKSICKHLIQPNIDEINRKLGQENDPMYLAYACEYFVRQREIKKHGLRT
jgi:hypothetical protein